MGSFPATRRRSVIFLLLALAAVGLWPAGTGLAVSLPHPEPPRRLTVQGTLIGRMGTGGKVRFNVVATDPRSWYDLKSVRMLMLLHGFSIQEIEFLVGPQTIGTTGRQPVKFGGPALPGSFLRIINGNTSRFVRQTFSITLTFWARVTESIPGGTRFRLLATDQNGNSSRATNPVAVSKGLLSWGTLALAAAVALFLGGFVGNTITSRRYRQREPSIWQIVERRLKEQRVRPPPRLEAAGVGERSGMSGAG
ncbi:MAG TPA: hypothetical protein VF986_00020 [Actinomycetota bacterium]